MSDELIERTLSNMKRFQIPRGTDNPTLLALGAQPFMSESERLSWPLWALGIATAVARRSEDPHVPVGAVALRSDWSVCGVGYNGAPSGVELIWSDRAARRPYVIHAEVNALRHASVMDMQGGAIVSTHIPCGNCMTVLASYKVDRVYYSQLIDNETYDLDMVQSIAEKCRITLFHL